MNRRIIRILALLAGLFLASLLRADPGPEIERKGRIALADLVAHDAGFSALLERAAGVLVVPDVVPMVFGVGGEYGEGVLLVDDRAVAYYALFTAPFGIDQASEYRAHVLVFLTRQALIDFRNTQGWEVGVHGDLPLLDNAAGLPGDARGDNPDRMVGLVFTEQGIQPGIDLAGGRFSRIAR